MKDQCWRRLYEITGIVQGVGFRPTVCRLATELGLGGWVRNCSAKVELQLEGDAAEIAVFFDSLIQMLPSQARMEGCRLKRSEFVGVKTAAFVIKASLEDAVVGISFPADLATCPDCLKEIYDPGSRWHQYPFTTCTSCGPRYTVISDLPYDRERTTLKDFPLCADCRSDYGNPASRRFHAESIACPVCGPELFAITAAGARLTGDPLALARDALVAGKIVAVRGVGGFLLAVDAFNAEAIALLRRRKTRPHKPLALMARDMEVLRQYCEVPPAARAILESPEAPIVILDLKESVPAALPRQLLSPDSSTLGVMLPNSPLQHLLFSRDEKVGGFDLLVMTSGNQGGEPICLGNDEARERLGAIADLFLCHNREISLRADDSLIVLQGEQLQLWRRGRGYAPGRLLLPRPLVKSTLGMGAELKNAIALGVEGEMAISAHIGDLETPGALDSLAQAVALLPSFLRRQPEQVAVDLHPDMHSSKMGRQLAQRWGVPLVVVQHHQAHALAVLAEHGQEQGLVLVFDGTGLGTDGNIWGAELLEIRGAQYRRLASFQAVALPGGDAAVREPARQLLARLSTPGQAVPEWLRQKYNISLEQEEIWMAQARRGLNAPLTHAAGRLFDSVAVLWGIAPGIVSYDGQSAVRVESWARRFRGGIRPEPAFVLLEREGMLLVDWQPLFQDLPVAEPDDTQKTAYAYAFHEAVATAAGQMLEFAMTASTLRFVAVSGGVFMNRLLTDLLAQRCRDLGVKLHIPQHIPPNDGGIAVGQVVAAAGSDS